ncbi:MAG: type II secretion system protein [bacterium]|nr:type II secretion system protein [bacterium]
MKRGFTLIEILVVVLIISILASLAYTFISSEADSNNYIIRKMNNGEQAVKVTFFFASWGADADSDISSYLVDRPRFPLPELRYETNNSLISQGDMISRPLPDYAKLTGIEEFLQEQKTKTPEVISATGAVSSTPELAVPPVTASADQKPKESMPAELLWRSSWWPFLILFFLVFAYGWHRYEKLRFTEMAPVSTAADTDFSRIKQEEDDELKRECDEYIDRLKKNCQAKKTI